MNKSELIERLSNRLGDQKTSSAAVDAVVNEIEQAVSKGEKVNIAGFGVFERRERAARTARNPRTGEPIKVKKTTVPAFRPGTSFKTLVAGGGSRNGSGNGGGSRAAQGSQQSAKAGSKRQTAYASAPNRQTAYASAPNRQTAYAQPSRKASAYGGRSTKASSAKAPASRSSRVR